MRLRKNAIGFLGKTFLGLGLSLIILSMSTTGILALSPPRPGEIERLKASGEFEERLEFAE